MQGALFYVSSIACFIVTDNGGISAPWLGFCLLEVLREFVVIAFRTRVVGQAIGVAFCNAIDSSRCTNAKVSQLAGDQKLWWPCKWGHLPFVAAHGSALLQK